MRARGGTRARREDAAALTPRQEEVLRLLERGYTNGEIAEALGISLDGAKFHVGEIIGKLGVSTREEAVEEWRGRRRRRVPLVALGALRWVGPAAAVVAVVSVSAVLIALAIGDDGDDRGAAGENPAPSPSVPASSPSAKAVTVTCPEREPLPTPIAQAVIDWIDFARFQGVSYMGRGFFAGRGDIQVPQSSLGPPYGRVALRLSGNVHDPSYRAQDCDASFLDPGTVLYTVQGYDPHFRIATADGLVYESYRAEAIHTAGEITDLRGKVTNIEFRESSMRVLGRFDDPAQVGRLVELFLGSAFDDQRQLTPAEYGLRDIQLVFERTYKPDIGRVWPGIWLPPEFNEAAKAAMGE